jgi:hypothetical protein
MFGASVASARSRVETELAAHDQRTGSGELASETRAVRAPDLSAVEYGDYEKADRGDQETGCQTLGVDHRCGSGDERDRGGVQQGCGRVEAKVHKDAERLHSPLMRA